LTADIITGFPGETEEDFRQTVEAAEILDIYHAHVFVYSKRPGTDAANFANQVPENIKTARSKIITETCGKNKENIHKKNNGKEFEVISEGSGAAKTRNFMDVKIQTQNTIQGDLQTIKIIGYDINYLIGEII